MTELRDLTQLPELPDDAHRHAETLVLAAHRAMNLDVWGGSRLQHYWDALTARVYAGTLTGRTLMDWWQSMVVRMSLQPLRPEDRRDVDAALQSGLDAAVLRALAEHREALVLRVRLMVDAKRAAREAATPTTPSTPDDGQEGLF